MVKITCFGRIIEISTETQAMKFATSDLKDVIDRLQEIEASVYRDDDSTPVKKVDYFVPDASTWRRHPDAKWIATDQNGMVYKYTGLYAPIVMTHIWIDDNDQYESIGNVEFSEDFAQSLFKRPEP